MEDEIEWGKVAGYASDGENLMVGANTLFLTQMKAKAPDFYILKCYCHSFYLVASHACQTLSKTAEKLIHDVYNYFANPPNRKKSLEEFKHFVVVEPYIILKPCQIRWLSVATCVSRLLYVLF